MDTAPAIFDAANPGSPLSVGAGQTAVLLMDYMNFIVGFTAEAGAAALQKGVALRKWADANNILVIHCLIDAKSASPKTFKGADRIDFFKTKMAENPGSELEPEALTSPDPAKEPVVLRTAGYISALKSHGLLDLLQKRGIKSLVLGGIATSMVVLRTVCDAADRDYITTVASDACADPNPAIHEAALKHIIPAQAHVATVEELQAQWAKGGK